MDIEIDCAENEENNPLHKTNWSIEKINEVSVIIEIIGKI